MQLQMKYEMNLQLFVYQIKKRTKCQWKVNAYDKRLWKKKNQISKFVFGLMRFASLSYIFFTLSLIHSRSYLYVLPTDFACTAELNYEETD